MKLTTVFLLIGCLHLSATSYSQMITLEAKDYSLKDVFQAVQKQTDFNVVYNVRFLKKAKPVSISAKQMPLEVFLEEILEEQGLTYDIRERTILIGQADHDTKPSPVHIKEELYQERVITGTVTDKDGKPLDGVTVAIKGGRTATVTNALGNYRIRISQNLTTLVFTLLGFEETEQAIGSQSTLDVSLTVSQRDLDEVVVVGYGTTRRGDITGSIASVKSKVFEESRQSSFINSLQGRVAGLQVTSGSGEPGSGSRILIRGANSLTGSSRPLIVIDGVPVNESEAPIANSRFGANSARDPLSSINPVDILSIDVLKDASATAIYGSRGANGVIIVTTKQGEAGITQMTYDGRFGASYTARRLDMLSADEFLDYRKDWVLMPDKMNIVYGYFNDWLFFENPSELEPSLKVPRDAHSLPQYDWQKEMYRDAALSSVHNVSMSGGTPTTKFFGSLGYNDEEGLFINNGYSRFNGRVRLDHQDEKLSVSYGLNGTYSNYNGAVQSGDGYANIGVTQAAIVSRPLEFENPFDVSTQGGWHKPSDNLQHADRTIATPNLSSNIVLNYRILPQLTLGNTLSGTMVTSKVNEFYNKNTPWGFALNGRAAISSSNWYGYTNFTSLNYQGALNSNSSLGVMGVFEISGSRYENNYIVKSNFSEQSTGIHDISKGEILQGASSGAGLTRRLSYLGRVNYDYKNRYLLTGSFRVDGSDRFGENNRYGLFPSAAFAWRISEETFLRNKAFLNDMKLRLSYGATGNSNISEFRYMARMQTSFYDDRLGLAPSSLPNPDLKWESTIQYNAGLDVSMFQNRLGMTFDIYSKQTHDMLYNAIVSAQSGFKTQWQNMGEVNNKGIEVAFNTRNIEKHNFSWNTIFTVSHNRNKVISIGDDLQIAPVGAGASTTSYIKQNAVGRIMVGQPIGMMYGYQLEGIYQLDDFSGWVDRNGILPDNDPTISWQTRNWVLKDGIVDASGLTRLRPGTFKFKNMDGSSDLAITEDDKVIIGQSQPDFFGGLGNTFRFGPIEASLFLTYSIGGEIFNSTKYELEGAMPSQYFNLSSTFWQNRWTVDNPTNKYPAYSDENYYNSLASQPNSYYVEDASYLRVQTLSLTYNVNKQLVKRIGIRDARLYYSGNNLFTLTNYSGFTPEVDSGNSLLTNFDTIGYPRSATHSLGVIVTF